MTSLRALDFGRPHHRSVFVLSVLTSLIACSGPDTSADANGDGMGGTQDGNAGALSGGANTVGGVGGNGSGTGGAAGNPSGGTGGTGNGGSLTGGAAGNSGGAAGGTEGGAGVGRYTVFELDVPYSETGVTNVWDTVKVTAVFTSPSNKTITVHGFYLSTNTWKVRFAPWEIGTYSYHVTVSGGSSPKTIDGSFNSVASGEKGFVRASAQNPLRLVFESDGSLYNALGMGNCLGDPNTAGFGLDGGDTSKGEAPQHADADTYLTAMGGEGKLNIFRWSVNNCAPDLWQTIAPSGNTYLAKEGGWGDVLVQKLRQHGFRVYLDMFGWKQPYSGQSQDQPSMDAVKRYIDYIVARYGAYVDFWEVCNESSPPTAWITLVASYVESIDPYHHLVSSSWEHPELTAIGIASPHWYEKEAELSSDTSTVQKIEAQRYAKKPIIFGEQGNSVQNWDPLSALRGRIRAWTAFFDEGHLIFWDQQGSKNYMSGAANLYIGKEQRGYFSVLQTFTAAVPADVTRVTVGSAPSGAVRTYGLTSSQGLYVYLRDAQSYTSARTGVTLSLNLAKAGTAKFYETQTGKVLQQASVGAGSSTLAVPSFVTDVALAIVY